LANNKLRQDKQLFNSTAYDDTVPAGPTMEPGPGISTAEFDFNALRSQIQRIIELIDANPTARWYTPPTGAGIGGGGGGSLTVDNDNTLVLTNVSRLVFKGGSEVEAIQTGPSEVTIYHPAPAYQPYWPTGVTDPVERVSARIAVPNVAEGNPFGAGTVGATNHDASRSTSITLTTPANTTGFGGDSTFVVRVYDANGVAVLDSFTTPPITNNGVFVSTSGFITVTISGYGIDVNKFQAKASVSIQILNILTSAGRDGGLYHVEATHITDTATDGGQVLPFNQPSVFLDTDPTTAYINGTVSIIETPGQVLTKHLSGVEYYILNSKFTGGVTDINQLNKNTAKTASNLVFTGTEYGLPILNHSPFGTGSANFSGYTFADNQNDVDYQITDWSITASNYRFLGNTADVSAKPQDTWNIGSSVSSPNASILVDTYGVTSTALYEGFDDEARRENIDGIGALASAGSFSGAGSFSSTATLVGTSNLQVWNSQLVVPTATTLIQSPSGPNTSNSNWTSFAPSVGGTNPDYTSLTVGSGRNYGRRFTQTPGVVINSFSMVFSGTFAGANMLSDLIAGNVEIYVYRIAIPVATTGVYGPPPGNNQPLRPHVSFNVAFFDDGLTVSGSGIREGSSSGNTINCTFATKPADTGIYVHIKILNATVKINSVAVSFF